MSSYDDDIGSNICDADSVANGESFMIITFIPLCVNIKADYENIK